MRIASINPVDNRVIKRFKEVSDRTVKSYIGNAKIEFETWRATTISARCKHFSAVAEILRKRKNEYAAIVTMEMGKPIQESIGEIEKCALVCDYYALHGKAFLDEENVKTEASHSYVMYEPLGIVFEIMPWNFPFWQVFRNAVPALLAGNVVLLKHAPNVPQCAQAIQDIFRKANMPKNCFQSLLISESKAKIVIEHPDVKMISLTGSDKAGSAVAAIAGRNLKKTLLELGGNDAFIVLEDANLKAAVETGIKSRMMNGGQSCIAAKRFIVVESVKDQFVELLTEAMSKIKMGDPSDENIDIGPLARKDLARKVVKQVRVSVRRGAKLIMGGNRLKWGSAFVNPTILTDVKPGMPAFDEEVFGPVASIISVKDEDEAVRCANDSVFGLGASIWSEDIELANRLAKRLNCGSVFINEMVKSDPRLPFGGVNRSGYGRELSKHGMMEFVNVKTIWIA